MSRNFIALVCVGLVSVPSAVGQITMMYPRSGIAARGAPIPVVNTFIAPTVPGWSEAAGSQLQYFPDHFTANAFQAVVPKEVRIPSGSQVEFLCNNGAGEPCNVAVFYYSCHPCESAMGNNGMALMTQDFERTRCAPTFTTGVAGGIQHRMVGYVKTIPHGATETIVIDGDLDFAIFALSNGAGVTCSDLSASECEAPGVNDFCKYTYGQCQLASCVSAGPSYGGGCDVSTCARVELPVPKVY